MKKINWFKSYFVLCAWLPALALSVFAFAVQAQTSATLTIQANQPGAQISANLFGFNGRAP